MNYLDILNPEQLKAVKHTGSPLLILAGAGSGKTRVITTKIAYLIGEVGIKPSSILAVTFTKKAAKEMQERAERLEPFAAKSYIRTFHSFGAWFLRLNAEEAGLNPNFTVYDDDDMTTIVSKTIKGLTKQEAKKIAHKISRAKDYGLMPQDSDALLTIDTSSDFPEQYAMYEKFLKTSGNVDFGDLILKPMLLLKENKNIRSYMHKKFSVIMVDEYQDSNMAQFQLLQQLVGEKTYVCVVGDDDQSIYKFRGAEVRNILEFQNYFPGTEIIKLERNYRSFEPILNNAISVVSNNKNRLGKTLIAQRGIGLKPHLVFLHNQDDETSFCASMIKEAAKQGVPYSDWAILYRTNAQSLGFETEFLHKKIPYTVIGSLKFYEREEIKDILAYIAFIINPCDEISFLRIVNKPSRTVGKITQDKIIQNFHEKISIQKSYTILDSCLEIMPKLPKKARDGLSEFTEIIQNMIEYIDENSGNISDILAAEIAEKKLLLGEWNADKYESISEINEKIKKDSKKTEKLSVFITKLAEKSGLINFHETQDEISGTQRVANLQELANSAVLYEKSRYGLLDFMDHIELDRSLENPDTTEHSDNVTLITIHNTKGLEFPRVIITGMEKGIFPRQDKTEEELEEERRLFYVGITRARDELYFTSCMQRRIYGKTDFVEVSPFLLELDDENIEIIGKIPPSYRYALMHKKNKAKVIANFGKDANAFNSSTKNFYDDGFDELAQRWCKGTHIYHDEMGYGQIIKTVRKEEYVIIVQFETGAVFRFMPEYQAHKLTIINE
ncbi:MAG: UvrD-helicase domain-containing protein [Treponema sp.]|nr:UvrD-helicase domain-containing protein [Treponema sp.]